MSCSDAMAPRQVIEEAGNEPIELDLHQGEGYPYGAQYGVVWDSESRVLRYQLYGGSETVERAVRPNLI